MKLPTNDPVTDAGTCCTPLEHTYLCVESPEEKLGGWSAKKMPWTLCHLSASCYLLPQTSLMTSVVSLYLWQQRSHFKLCKHVTSILIDNSALQLASLETKYLLLRRGNKQTLLLWTRMFLQQRSRAWILNVFDLFQQFHIYISKYIIILSVRKINQLCHSSQLRQDIFRM